MRPTLVLALLALSTSAHAQTPAPKAQLPADQRAYASAMKTRDAAQRIAALQQFTKDFR